MQLTNNVRHSDWEHFLVVAAVQGAVPEMTSHVLVCHCTLTLSGVQIAHMDAPIQVSTSLIFPLERDSTAAVACRRLELLDDDVSAAAKVGDLLLQSVQVKCALDVLVVDLAKERVFLLFAVPADPAAWFVITVVRRRCVGFNFLVVHGSRKAAKHKLSGHLPN